jgi:NAD(P)-dependent dehydrogenase (short-subunit alcohol dehydrogenase family)
MSYIESLFSLKDQVAVVTGAARGNGLAIAEGLSRAGAMVLLVDRLPEVIEASHNLLGASHHLLNDLSTAKDMDELVKHIYQDFPSVSILVNNAGITITEDALCYTEEAWDATMNINVKAAWILSQRVGRIMAANAGGSIVNITSLGAEFALPNNPAYLASKGALRQLSRSLAYDLGRYGIRVNNVGPGYMRTIMTTKSWEDEARRKLIAGRTILGRWGTSQDLIGAVLFLCSKAASYITGQDIYVDGGWSIKGI